MKLVLSGGFWTELFCFAKEYAVHKPHHDGQMTLLRRGK
jgi:hypothetical protein